MNYFEVKVIIERDGKDVSEKYILRESPSYSVAEQSICDYLVEPCVIDYIKRCKISETIGEGLEKYFKFKVAFISVNESGKEKRTNVTMLVNADNIDDAKSSFVEFMKSTLADYIITDISETKIVDVI